MENFRKQKIDLLIISFMLKIYKCTRNIFPKLSVSLKKYIEKRTLDNVKEVNNIVSNMNKR